MIVEKWAREMASRRLLLAFWAVACVVSVSALPVDDIDVVKLSALLEAGSEGKPASLAAQLKGSYDPCKAPVVLVPGLGGSVLDVMVTDDYVPPHYACKIMFPKGSFTTGYNRLWPSLAAFDFLPFHVYRDCWLHAMSTTYNATTRSFSNVPGVLVQPRDYGGVDGVSNLFLVRGNWGPSMSAVYQDVVTRLNRVGYVPHKNLRGVPYDFRLVGDEKYLAGEYARMKATIEEMVNATAAECADGRSRPAIVMMHSLGGLYFFRFLESVDAAWKDAYIRTALSINTPWLGAPKSLRAIVSGDSEGLPGANEQYVASERFMGGLLWAVPSYADDAPASWKVPILQIGTRKYTTSPDDLSELFKVAGTPSLARIVNDFLRPKVRPRAPGVDYHCAMGHGVVTESYYAYGGVGVKGSGGDPIMYREVLEQPAPWARKAASASFLVNGGGADANGTHALPVVGLLNPVPELAMPISKALSSLITDPMQGDGTVPLTSLQFCETFADGNGDRPVTLHRFAGGDHLGLLSMDTFVDFVAAFVEKYQ